MNIEEKSIPPQDKYFKRAILLDRLWIFFTLLALLTVLLGSKIQGLRNINWLLTVVLAVIIFILGEYRDEYKHNGDRIRRQHLFDNALGTKKCETDYNGYYTNDFISNGDLKLLANVHESAFWTKNLISFFKTLYFVLLVILAITVFFLSVRQGINEKSSFFARLFISSFVFRRYLNLKDTYKETSRICEKSIDLINSFNSQLDIHSEIFYLTLEYEIIIDRMSYLIRDWYYKKKKGELNNKWDQISNKYYS